MEGNAEKDVAVSPLRSHFEPPKTSSKLEFVVDDACTNEEALSRPCCKERASKKVPLVHVAKCRRKSASGTKPKELKSLNPDPTWTALHEMSSRLISMRRES